MPLPKAPSKPAQLVDMSTAVLATELSTPRSKPEQPARKTSPSRPPGQARLLSEPPRTDQGQLALLADASSGLSAEPESAQPSATRPAPAGTRIKAPASSPLVEPSPAGTLTQVETRPPAPVPASCPTPVATTSNRGVRAQRRRSGQEDQTRLFVLDTNVLMHDPTSLFRFAEHDVFLPIMTLEELDNHKKARLRCRATFAPSAGHWTT